ncbi:hypothetical protein BS78_K226100 [Paspalum vaginatum]|uniref:Uncharacterized protein n=1 Tax=Paspalum vaginatum TaxID=158149 RepID=A0A9W7XDQ3_9POAL|nr:hypothetical protein BS78_K226100 [Paspalum vaginatum]
MPATTKVMLLSWAWAAASLILLLLVLHGSGAHFTGIGMEAELEMESEAHRRLLWEATLGRWYISYDALRGDVVSCSKTGLPYYNCRISTTANPYIRGCESITRCRDSDPWILAAFACKGLDALCNVFLARCNFFSVFSFLSHFFRSFLLC